MSYSCMYLFMYLPDIRSFCDGNLFLLHQEKVLDPQEIAAVEIAEVP